MHNIRRRIFEQYYTQKKDNLNQMLAQVISDASAINIPVSSDIDRQVYIDYGEEFDGRAGFCEWTINGDYKIHITDRLLRSEDKDIKNILAHEVLHTCPLCKNHYFVWTDYANTMNKTYGYHITEKLIGWESVEAKITK